jgi:hypothetical protein
MSGQRGGNGHGDGAMKSVASEDDRQPAISNGQKMAPAIAVKTA